MTNFVELVASQLHNELNNYEQDQDWQRKITEHMVDEGARRFDRKAERERVNGNAIHTAGYKQLAQVVVPAAAADIEALIEDQTHVRRKASWLRLLSLLPGDVTATIAVTSLFQFTVKDGAKTTAVSKAIGRALHTEAAARAYKKVCHTAVSVLSQRMSEKTNNVEVRQRQFVNEMRDAFLAYPEDMPEAPTNKELVTAGRLLLHILETHGVARTNTRKVGVKTWNYVELSGAAIQIIADTEALARFNKPRWLPMVVPPVPWSEGTRGGYIVAPALQTQGLVATHQAGCRATEEDAARSPLTHVYEAVNTSQEVAFEINSKVEAVARALWSRERDVGKLVTFQQEQMPVKPADMDTNEAARKAWRKEAREVHNRNGKRRSLTLSTHRTLQVAEMFRDEPAIYFPKYLDFRGRMYDRASDLCPQGDDLQKGLLRFAIGKPLGEVGAYWLAVHGANVWGEDKCSFDDRVEFIKTNEEWILQCATDPYTFRKWEEADKPWQFLAFCFEWSGHTAQGEDFLSHLPVALDGSCNGLQHLSALLRDPVGAAAVNLAPAAKPQDIYTQVLDRAVAELKRRAARGEPTAQKWLPLMKRKTVKRNVMTLPYGATRTGFAQQIFDDTMRDLIDRRECPFPEPFRACQYLGEIVWQATGEVVRAGQVAMKWLQDVCRVVNEYSAPMVWTTPSGFTVRQFISKASTARIELVVMGQRLSLSLGSHKDGSPDRKRMVNSIAPNFVHSMDAAHMVRTVNKLREVTFEDVAVCLVHDSYAVHASDAWTLSTAVRQAFVEMYSERCWLENFRECAIRSVAEHTGKPDDEIREKVPPVPEYLGFDITQVINSLYFFS